MDDIELYMGTGFCHGEASNPKQQCRLGRYISESRRVYCFEQNLSITRHKGGW